MNPLENYLNRATRGLWGRKRLEVREELTTHVLEKAHGFEIAGLSHDEAMTRALETLGDAGLVRRALIGVHLMLPVFRSGFLALIASLVVATLVTSQAQVSGLVTNAAGASGPFKHDYWFSLASLRATLEPQKVVLKLESDTLSMRFPGGTRASTPIGRFNNYQPYAHAFGLVQSFRKTGLPITLSGWSAPRINVDGVRLEMGGERDDARTYFLYANLFLNDLVYNQPSLISKVLEGWSLARWNRDTPLPNWKTHVLRVRSSPNTVYAIAARDPREAYAPTSFDFAPVRADGTLKVHLPFERVTFSDDLRDLERGRRNPSPRAVLLRFAERIDNKALKYALAVPENPESTAVR
jgi:hypothetical protein